MHEKIKGSILIISHQERILDIADKIVLLADGHVAAEGAKADILPKLLSSMAGCRFTTEVSENG
jgi:Fe-S cluster assembly ATP-binding protein